MTDVAESQTSSTAELDAVPLPPVPGNLAETGLNATFLDNLMMKAMYTLGLETTAELAQHLKLPETLVKAIFEDARAKRLMTVADVAEFSTALTLRFQLTDNGRARAMEALEHSQYSGATPVPLDDYMRQVEHQSISAERIDPEAMARSFEGVFLSPELAGQMGAALNQGHSLLLYGPPGNGKSIYSEAIVRSFVQSVYIPYAVVVDGQVISVFDPAVHEPVADDDGPPYDPRWVRCRRPAVIAGGELTMEMLELIYDPDGSVYEAPLQLKASGGVLIIDDFGRQAVPPDRILNRWIVPLERKRDYLALRSGKKVPVTFDELVIFSTNLEPETFMDAAMMRRIHYKIEIGAPGREEFEGIFRTVCQGANLALTDDVLRYLFDEFYPAGTVEIARFHPKWIVEHVISACAYEGTEPRLDRAHVAEAVGHLAIAKKAPKPAAA